MNDQPSSEPLAIFPMTTFISVVLFGVLLLARNHPVRIGAVDLLSIPIGIAGLLVLSISIRSLQIGRRSTEPDLAPSRYSTVMLEFALWALVIAFVVGIGSAARG